MIRTRVPVLRHRPPRLPGRRGRWPTFIAPHFSTTQTQLNCCCCCCGGVVVPSTLYLTLRSLTTSFGVEPCPCYDGTYTLTNQSTSYTQIGGTVAAPGPCGIWCLASGSTVAGSGTCGPSGNLSCPASAFLICGPTAPGADPYMHWNFEFRAQQPGETQYMRILTFGGFTPDSCSPFSATFSDLQNFASVTSGTDYGCCKFSGFEGRLMHFSASLSA